MKKYIAPEFEVSKFEAVDIVALSSIVDALTGNDEDELPNGYSGRDLKWIQ